MGLSPDIQAVLERQLGVSGEATPATAGSEEARLLELMGFQPEQDRPAVRVVSAGIAAARRDGTDADTLVALAQAYSRALGRVVAAESDNIRRLVKREPEPRRAERLEALLERNLSLAHELFRTLHRAMLREALQDTLTEESLAEPDVTERTIALVDVCNSTGYLTGADGEKTRRLVDALFEAGRAASVRQGVWVVKYVGDGVFLLGRQPADVVQAARHAISVLEREMGVEARAGLAAGPVVRRAGDYFGLTVNLAQRLTTKAEPDELLASHEVAAGLPEEWIQRRRQLDVRGIEKPVAVASVDCPSVGAPGA